MGNLVHTPRSWSPGEPVTAADLNAEIRGPLIILQAGWDSYTPQWTAATNPSIGNGGIQGAFNRVGKTVSFRIQMLFGSTTTYGSGGWLLSLPVNPKIQGEFFNNGIYRDASTNNAYPVGGLSFTSTIGLRVNDVPLATVTGTVPFAAGVGDTLIINGHYECV